MEFKVLYLFYHLFHLVSITGKWDKAYKLGAEHLGKSETCKFLTAEGKRLEEMKELEEAELVYLSIEKPDLAITMYKNYKDYDKVRR